MMISEFTERTGFAPTASEFQKIEEAYYNFDGNKDAFCKAFVEEDGERKICAARAERIAKLESDIVELEKQFKTDAGLSEKRIADLEAKLEAEQEWKSHEDEHNVKQADYIALATSGGTRILSDDEAKEAIAREFGFDPEKVTIIREVDKLEISRHNRVRKVGTISREPIYNATDWNYIRFNCSRWFYEMSNGELHQYYR